MNILKVLRDKPWVHSTASATLEQYSGPAIVSSLHHYTLFLNHPFFITTSSLPPSLHPPSLLLSVIS
jgi:hypothetical protein